MLNSFTEAQRARMIATAVTVDVAVADGKVDENESEDQLTSTNSTDQLQRAAVCI